MFGHKKWVHHEFAESVQSGFVVEFEGEPALRALVHLIKEVLWKTRKFGETSIENTEALKTFPRKLNSHQNGIHIQNNNFIALLNCNGVNVRTDTSLTRKGSNVSNYSETARSRDEVRFHWRIVLIRANDQGRKSAIFQQLKRDGLETIAFPPFRDIILCHRRMHLSFCVPRGPWTDYKGKLRFGYQWGSLPDHALKNMWHNYGVVQEIHVFLIFRFPKVKPPKKN